MYYILRTATIPNNLYAFLNIFNLLKHKQRCSISIKLKRDLSTSILLKQLLWVFNQNYIRVHAMGGKPTERA